MKKALITGITGQDGSFLAELLLSKNYKVHGIIRRSSQNNLKNVEHLKDRVHLHYGDLSDSLSLNQIITNIKPDEIYNLAAQSNVGISFVEPLYSGNIDGLGALRILECVRQNNLNTKIYQASTSELFGKVEEFPQNENTPFHPYSPYGIAKQYAYWIIKEYREAYNMFCCNGILFNHESERRGLEFVTRKITKGISDIINGKIKKLYLGNLDSKRDWGYAKDYVEYMWLMLQQKTPDDYVIATGEQHTIREFCCCAFKYAGIDLKFTGKGLNEKGIDVKTGKILVEVSEDLYRPTDVINLCGDPSKAINKLGWNPKKTSFDELVKIMVKNDLGDL